jgi:hypothetical protein
MALSKKDLVYEAVLEGVNGNSQQTLDGDGFATYTFDDDDRDEMVREICGRIFEILKLGEDDCEP